MRYLLILLLLASSSVSSSEATVGDFGSNQQAETITSTTETVVNQKGTPVTTAVSPSAPSYNQDVCVVSSGRGMQTLHIGLSFGATTSDPVCEMLKLSRQLEKLGLKVAATSVLCNDPRVFHAMLNASTPCPIKGKIGDAALQYYEENTDTVPDAPSVYKRKEPGERLRYDRSRKRYVRY
tara:strand:+ start:273 stop:812 length:540 start_codon:yes stop_codon:yes gene_type:complete